MSTTTTEKSHYQTEDEDTDEETNNAWGDWNDDDDNGSISESSSVTCLLCPNSLDSSQQVFSHCIENHGFDFHKLTSSLRQNFYTTFKIINFLRSQVAENKCWICGSVHGSNDGLLEHLKLYGHLSIPFEKCPTWQDDRYLKPFLQDDPLLYSLDFEEQDDGKDGFDDIPVVEEECFKDGGDEALNNMRSLVEDLRIDGEENSSAPEVANRGSCQSKSVENGLSGVLDPKKKSKVSFAKVAEKEIKNVNEDYFGAYSGYTIHREMLGDKVRMDAYGGAILKNPSLFKGAVVMDVGCGTGILSLFAAQAGAAKVIAVEASQKMASVARQIAKENNLLKEDNGDVGPTNSAGVISVVEGMMEELDTRMGTAPKTVDVILSEWMGYCLLYESMLSSVIYARDRWLKPGGAILPDTAEMFVAGFGKGGTSLSFWEDVYGFNMSCIGKEVVEDASQQPIIDVLESKDIVTETSTLQVFDLMTMKSEEMDFTTNFELKLKHESEVCGSGSNKACQENCMQTVWENHVSYEKSIAWCYGLVLWFETGFTARFCKEMPTILSTSPYNPKTHWSQTILTFKQPIALLADFPNKGLNDPKQEIGSASLPASCIKGRISIARSTRHRSIDISVETMATDHYGNVRKLPIQIFNI